MLTSCNADVSYLPGRCRAGIAWPFSAAAFTLAEQAGLVNKQENEKDSRLTQYG
jgi:hypothetical protein